MQTDSIRKYMEEFLKGLPGARQLVTPCLTGANVYWDGEKWFLSMSTEKDGNPITEEEAYWLIKEE